MAAFEDQRPSVLGYYLLHFFDIYIYRVYSFIWQGLLQGISVQGIF